MSTDQLTITPAETHEAVRDAPPAPAQAGHGGITPALLVTLALLASVAPFATDLYLPSFPAMTVDLGTSAAGVQLTLTAFLVGLALGQLVFGPLSDRWGRVRPLVAGAVLCVVASAAAALAPTLGWLVTARLVQGLAGAAGMVIGRAIIADVATGKPAARAFSVMMLVGGIAPVVAPLVGSLLAEPFGWRGTLWLVWAISVVMLVAVLVVVRETHTPARRDAARDHHAAHGSPLRPLGSARYLGSTLAFGLAFAAMMAYISASPFVFQTMVGLTTVQYGLLFGFNALVLAATSAASARLTATRSVDGVLGAGLAILLGASLTLLAVVLLGAAPGWVIPPIVVAVGSLGLILGNATAQALSAVPRAAGIGSAVLGALQFALAAAVAPLVSLGGQHTAVPLAVVMTVTAALAMTSHLVTRGR